VCGVVDVDVDGEMSVDVSHLVSESFRHTNEHVLNQTFDSPQACKMLAIPMMHSEYNCLALFAEGHINVANILAQNTAGPFDCDVPRLHLHGDPVRDSQRCFACNGAHDGGGGLSALSSVTAPCANHRGELEAPKKCIYMRVFA